MVVALLFGEGRVRMAVRDNGVGFQGPVPQDPGAGRGLGLLGMRERVELLGGRLQIRSRAGWGTRVTAEVPLRGALGAAPGVGGVAAR